jgi:hypothetical protein
MLGADEAGAVVAVLVEVEFVEGVTALCAQMLRFYAATQPFPVGMPDWRL